MLVKEQVGGSDGALGIGLALVVQVKSATLQVLAGLAIGFALSFALVLVLRTDFWTILANLRILNESQIDRVPGISIADGSPKAYLNSVWAWPVTVFITWGCGILFANRKPLQPQ